jgi:hypothetical protein
MAKAAEKAKTLYNEYPSSPEGLQKWKAHVEDLFSEERRNM